MALCHTEHSVRDVFRAYGFSVLSVDFNPINKEKHGFTEQYDQYMCAFVYFTIIGGGFPYSESFVQICTSEIDMEPLQISLKGNAGLNWSMNEFWMLLKNKKPIARSRFNIHQIVENARYMELQIEQQAKKIEEQAKQIEALMEMIKKKI